MLLSVLVALTVIMVTARLMGALFKRLNQPAVMGEVVGGLLLGPSLLGRISPEAAAALLPAESAPFLGVISQLGVILYMFLVGLELDLRCAAKPGRHDRDDLGDQHRRPVCLGAGLAWVLFELSGGNRCRVHAVRAVPRACRCRSPLSRCSRAS